MCLQVSLFRLRRQREADKLLLGKTRWKWRRAAGVCASSPLPALPFLCSLFLQWWQAPFLPGRRFLSVATASRRSRAIFPPLCSLPYFVLCFSSGNGQLAFACLLPHAMLSPLFFLCFFARSSGFLRALAVQPLLLSSTGCLERGRRPTLPSS